MSLFGVRGMVFVTNPNSLDIPEGRPFGPAPSRWNIRNDDIDGKIRLFDEDIANNIQANEELPDLTAAIRFGGLGSCPPGEILPDRL